MYKYTVSILILLSSSVFSQDTTNHNEIHKAYESAVNSLSGCASPNFIFSRSGRYQTLNQDKNSASINNPEYSVSCDRPERELVVAVNINGKQVDSNGITYIKDPHGSYMGDVDGIKGTDRKYVFDFERQVPNIKGSGDFELVLHTIDDDCGGWELNISNTTVTGFNVDGDYLTYIVKFSTTGLFTNIKYNVNPNCKMRLYGWELYKINESQIIDSQ